jgi:hypothetical protein
VGSKRNKAPAVPHTPERGPERERGNGAAPWTLVLCAANVRAPFIER